MKMYVVIEKLDDYREEEVFDIIGIFSTLELAKKAKRKNENLGGDLTTIYEYEIDKFSCLDNEKLLDL